MPENLVHSIEIKLLQILLIGNHLPHKEQWQFNL